VRRQPAEHVLVDEHPGGDEHETGGQNENARLAPGNHETQQHHREEAEEEFGERLLDRRAGGDREHADVVVDGVHFVHAVESLRALVDVLALVGDRVVAFVLVRDILLDDLASHARALAGGLAAVEDAVEVEMDADTVWKGVRRVVRCRQRDPPDRRKVGDDHQYRRHGGECRDDQIRLAGGCC
jgi:hypothetical protein